MKIGILTYHRSNNYGALLQGIALREVLVRAGHQATFIDYWPAYHRHMYALFSFRWMMSRKGIGGKFKYLKNCIANFANRKARKAGFDKFIAEFIEPYISSAEETYDVIVHGSDQIWRKQPEIMKYNPVYYGYHEIVAKRKVSYAASMGILPQKNSEKQIVKEYLTHLDGISVREKGLKDFVEELGYENVCHDLDPTLLLTSDFWASNFKLEKSKERYALYYKIQDSFDIKELKKYTSSKGLRLKVIQSKAVGRDTEENIITASPLKFLQLIYGAEMVFTSSFHGLAFSLIFNKPFYASFLRNSGRAESILAQTGLLVRILKPKSSITDNSHQIDFTCINTILNGMREKSMDNLITLTTI